MDEIRYSAAAEDDLPFIMETYHANLEALHGTYRGYAVWKKLLSDENAAYYVVFKAAPVAWFRIDREADGLWLGMLQVSPRYHRQGIGRYVLSVAEDIARAQGASKIGIHTTEDNAPAKALYQSAGYSVTEYGPCTTADGAERMGYTFEKSL